MDGYKDREEGREGVGWRRGDITMLSCQDIIHNYSLPVVYSYKRYESNVALLS